MENHTVRSHVDGGKARSSRMKGWIVPLILVLCWVASERKAVASCSAPANPIEAENCLPGSPPSEWDVSDGGSDTIVGFATDISVNQGQTISFKINTNAKNYTIDIYRMGYYGGMGARKIVSIKPSAALPQTQPACLTDSATSLYDCGNWAVSASWQVPANATSGIYFAHLIRTDTGADNHIVFIVRNDSSHSNILFQTSDETWEAYNSYGGFSVYHGTTGDLDDRAYKVSYNRPFNNRTQPTAVSWVFYAEYAMVRWLEANGYDVSYFTGVDAARNGVLIKNHKVYLSVGHDEYWSGPQRANVEAALAAGVNLAFFSGNEVFWKTRWENSIDGSNTPYRTMVCYKESLANAVIDPADPPTWTGSWRDPRFSPPADGGRPENGLTGTLFEANGPGDDNLDLSIQVPAAYGKLRFWRNTSIANLSPGQVATLPAGTLGYEWDVDRDNGWRPAGLFDLSSTTVSLTTDYLLDYAGTYGAGTATHSMTLYRAPSGALVFGAGTVQWSFGLDSNHDNVLYSAPPTDVRMQQATVNLLADMGVQPATLQSGLVPASASTDTTPPVSTITFPNSSTSLQVGTPVTITGTATDTGGGVVAGVEVSVDGGVTWHPASGTTSWTYHWTPTESGSITLESRAVDDSANLEKASAGVNVTVAAQVCPCDEWSSSTVPGTPDSGDSTGGEFGVKFRSDIDGFITGIRFYKSSANTGTHVGHLWTSNGTLLASVTFTNETSSGWQQATFSSPVRITANTTYVASYYAPSGHYSADLAYFTNTVDMSPLHFLANNLDGPNGVYSYGFSGFPTSTYDASNYWVDVIFVPLNGQGAPPPSLGVSPTGISFVAFYGQGNPASQQLTVSNLGGNTLNWTASANVSWLTLSPASGTAPSTITVTANTAGLAIGTYNGTITLTASGANNSPQTIAVTLSVSQKLFLSNFDDGSMQGWAISPLGLASNWSVVNKALQYNGGGHTQVYAGNAAWTDYSFQADIKLSTLSDYPGGIRGRVNPTTGAAYTVWLYPAEGLIKLFRTVAWNIDAGATQLGQASVTFDTVNFHTVKLTFQGSQIQVFYDGQQEINVTDASYGSGMVALDVSNQVVTFDNVLAVTTASPPSSSLNLSVNSLSFSANYQGPNPSPQTVQLTSSGGSLAWTGVSSASWLSVSPTSGATNNSLQISVNSSTLAAGSYSGTIQVTSLGATNSPQSINVMLNVIVPPPAIVLAPSLFDFSATLGQPAPGPQALAVTNSGNGVLSWTATGDSSWLTISPASGSTPAAASVGINLTGLSPGDYNGNITVSSSGAVNSPQSVPVSLRLVAQDMSENFSDQGVGWIISPLGNAGGWSVSNGVYSYNGGGATQSCAGNGAWSDYTFDANILLSSLSNYPGGVRARVNPSTGAGYAVWLYPGSGVAILYRVPQWNIDGGGTTMLAQAAVHFDNTAYHDLRMDFRGSQITVYWDGNFLMSATDSSYSSGFVCLDVSNQPISYKNIQVAAIQTAVALDAPSPSNLVFSSAPGQSPGPQTVSISAGGAATTWAVTTNASWLTATASNSLTPGVVTVSANGSGLSEGTYTGNVSVFAPGASNSPVIIPVTFGVKTAVMNVTSTGLTFFGAMGHNPSSQTISVANAGTGSLSWTASADSSWIGLNPTSGTAPSTITVSPDVSSLSVGQYNGNVTVSSNDVENSPATVPVSLQVGTWLFSDDFSSGSAGQWTVSPMGSASNWLVVNGAYTYNGAGASQSWAGSALWSNYTVAVDFKLSTLSDYPGGIRARLNPSTGAGYGVWIYPAEGILKLFAIPQWNIDGGGTILLATSSAVKMDTNWHNLRIVMQGPSIKVYYDNALVMQVTDTRYTQGAVALDVSNQPISFDNVAVIGF